MAHGNPSSNFAFLSAHSPLLADLGATAERLFPFDPASCVLKLRMLGEALTRDMAARLGLRLVQPTQAELLRAVDARLGLDARVRQLFELLRRTGNLAAHELQHGIGHKEGLEALRIAREVAVWFHRTFGNEPAFRPGPFRLPDDPSQVLVALEQRIAQLGIQLDDAQTARAAGAEVARLLQAQAEQERAMAEQAREEGAIYQQLAEEASERTAMLQAQFDAQLRAAPADPGRESLARYTKRASAAAQSVHLDEDTTRQIIDLQLTDAGWEADSLRLTHRAGARPEPGRHRAIAEWPTDSHDVADYLLFAGLTPIAAIEAKRRRIDVAGKIGQAERYARGFAVTADQKAALHTAGRTGTWPDGQGGEFRLPFVYASNGRPYARQSPEFGGTWFRDLRLPSNTARPVAGFHEPAGLLDLLKRDREDAECKLAADDMAYLHLRDYQCAAIAAAEAALADGRRSVLLAMATGTGKTRTIIGFMYRLLKAERFRRILFLVDRNELGRQAQDAFNEAPLEQMQPLSKIYNVARLGDMAAAAETRVQVATVQAMVHRLFASDAPPSVDTYDCIIVDEAHRGYALDQEMTEGESAVRDPAQYLSTYRRVLDHFDAVRIGLTATPARHTTEIFGKPVYSYSYAEAVADDWLIDHEPPIRYETLLNTKGIHFARGEKVQSLNVVTGEIDTAELDDELDFQVESFNRQVIASDFNRVVCEQLANELDPFGEEKTLIFCATDAHADMVKRLLDTAFSARYGVGYNEASVRKLTGSVDNVDALIRRYKNERQPSIAITVDLLTTGIDVPSICHIVFMRRVRSRILYEQMMGRATRRCDAIGKTVFKIYDPVDLYAALEDVSTMRPLVKDPNVTIEQLVGELGDPASYQAPGTSPGRMHADDVLDALSQKVMRVLRRADHEARRRPEVRAQLDQLQHQGGVAPKELHAHLHALGAAGAAMFLQQHADLLPQIARVRQLLAGKYGPPILAPHEDALLSRAQNWGPHAKPADYLEHFAAFVREQVNASAALAVVVNRPKDLTRAGLREVRLLLNAKGYSEANLQAAWRDSARLSDQALAASIVGYIRQAALGEALVPFEQRVASAMLHVYAQQPWTPVQRRWLEKLARQLTHEVVVDADFINAMFAPDGGSKQLDRVLDGRLADVLSKVATHLWPQSA